MDWDRMTRNMARGNGFAGRGSADEDAYFTSFAGEPQEILPTGWFEVLTRFPIWLRRVIVVR